MTFPEKISDREDYIYQNVLSGNFDAEWAPLEFSSKGKTIKLNVMKDALLKSAASLPTFGSIVSPRKMCLPFRFAYATSPLTQI